MAQTQKRREQENESLPTRGRPRRLPRAQTYDAAVERQQTRIEELAAEPTTKRARLIRIAPPRVQAVIDALRLVAKLANPNSYDLRPADVSVILAPIFEELTQTEAALSDPRGGAARSIVALED